METIPTIAEAQSLFVEHQSLFNFFELFVG